MRAAALFLLLLVSVACASPPPQVAQQNTPDVPEASTPPPISVVDSGVATAEAAVEAAAPELPACAHSLKSAKHVVVGKVRELGGDTVKEQDGTATKVWAIIDIVEVLYGEDIAPQFKKSFYAITTTDFFDKSGGHGFGGHGPGSELQSHKGETFVFMLALPNKGGTEEGLPPKLLKAYGKTGPMIYGYCPLETKDQLVAARIGMETMRERLLRDAGHPPTD